MVVSPNTSEDINVLEWWDANALAKANIVPATGLATDYLNVFNEAIMLLGLLPTMPELISELSVWQPRTYEEHFRQSGFQGKELALLAYHNATAAITEPFDALSQQTSELILQAIKDVRALLTAGEDVSEFVSETTLALKSTIIMLDAMIHGEQKVDVQDNIDALFED